jgi:hypothetical protein
MAILKNVLLKELSAKVDERIDSNIKLFATTEIDENIGELIYLVSTKLADQFEYENKQDIPTCKCIFINSNEITFILDENEDACYINFCVYPIHKWIRNNLSKIKIIVNMLEELCRFYWNLEDEVQICYKVLEIMKRINKRLELEHFYDPDYIEHLYNIGYQNK